MPAPITIAHLSDVHLGPIAGFAPRYWNLKRALGFANWLWHRRGAYQRPVLDRIIVDVETQRPDHIAVTGDLTNLGLPREHVNALEWLERIGPPERMSVIPGNHDIYSSLHGDPGTRRWARYMASGPEGSERAGSTGDFPFVRMLGRVALIGVNSAVPTPPFVASGRVGEGQLVRLAAILDRFGAGEIFRLVLIHHPPLPGQARRKRDLVDAPALQAVLSRHGAELVVHGHNHVSSLAWCPTASGKVPVVGVPSASHGRPYKREPLARYNLYRVAGPPWTIEVVGRGLQMPGGPIVEVERTTLTRHQLA